jgi:hypothetical protein
MKRWMNKLSKYEDRTMLDWNGRKWSYSELVSVCAFIVGGMTGTSIRTAKCNPTITFINIASILAELMDGSVVIMSTSHTVGAPPEYTYRNMKRAVCFPGEAWTVVDFDAMLTEVKNSKTVTEITFTMCDKISNLSDFRDIISVLSAGGKIVVKA